MAKILRQWDTSPEHHGAPVDPLGAYLKHRDQAMTDIETFQVSCGTLCPAHSNSREHGKMIARFGCACHHVLNGDPVNPEAVFCMPKGYYLCRTCFKLYQAYRFNFDKELEVVCSHCLDEKLTWLKQRWPDRFTDLSTGTELEPFNVMDPNDTPRR